MQNIQERLTGSWPATGASSRRTARFAVSISAFLTAELTTSVDMGKAKKHLKRIFKKNHGFSARCPAFFFRNLTCLPQALEIMENLENPLKKFHAWKSHGIRKKERIIIEKIMEFCEII